MSPPPSIIEVMGLDLFSMGAQCNWSQPSHRIRKRKLKEYPAEGQRSKKRSKKTYTVETPPRKVIISRTLHGGRTETLYGVEYMEIDEDDDSEGFDMIPWSGDLGFGPYQSSENLCASPLVEMDAFIPPTPAMRSYFRYQSPPNPIFPFGELGNDYITRAPFGGLPTPSRNANNPFITPTSIPSSGRTNLESEIRIQPLQQDVYDPVTRQWNVFPLPEDLMEEWAVSMRNEGKRIIHFGLDFGRQLSKSKVQPAKLENDM